MKKWHFDVSGIDSDSSVAHNDSTVPEPAEDTPTTPDDNRPLASDPADTKNDKPKKKGVRITDILGGEILLRHGVRKFAPLMVLIVGCFLVLIYNRYKIEDLVREKKATEERIKYLREHRIQMQKKYQESIKISNIAKELDTLGIGLMSGPPYELKTDD